MTRILKHFKGIIQCSDPACPELNIPRASDRPSHALINEFMYISPLTKWIAALCAVIVAHFIIRRLLFVWSAYGSLRSSSPVLWMLWYPTDILEMVVRERVIPRNAIYSYSSRFTGYMTSGSTTVIVVNILQMDIFVYTADVDAIQTLTGDRHLYPKKRQSVAAAFGEHLVTAEGDTWARHRQVARPAFDETNTALVWQETIKTMTDWFQLLDNDTSASKGICEVDVLAAITNAAFIIICSAGFAQTSPWHEDAYGNVPTGHLYTFRKALFTAMEMTYWKVLTPNWLGRLLSRVQLPILTTKHALTTVSWADLHVWVQEIIDSAKADYIRKSSRDKTDREVSKAKGAILRKMVHANIADVGDDGEPKLSDEHIVSNMLIFVVAGHETTAHTLSFAIALLAMYPEFQKKLHDESVRVFGAKMPDTTASFKDLFPQLEYATAFFRESLRCHPPVARLQKYTAKDTTLRAREITRSANGDIEAKGSPYEVFVPKESKVVLDIWGLNYNPLCWGSDAQDFKPERFIDTAEYRWPRNALMSFSQGSRGCIGSRFALVEGVCILALIALQYEILVPLHLEGKPLEEQQRVLLAFTRKLTVTPTNLSDLRFRKR